MITFHHLGAGDCTLCKLPSNDPSVDKKDEASRLIRRIQGLF
jgi:hypothetical protein